MITSGADKLNTITMQEDTIMTNKEKALALINTFASGDTEKAKELLSPGYIQHNLAFGTGADAFVAAVAGLAQAPVKTTVNNIRAFEDGDKVFLQTVYNFAGAGEQVAFDIFRFDEDGKIAEHWDNLAAKAEPNPSGHTQIDGTLEKKDADKEETRKVVAGFVGDVLRGENPDKLTSYYDGDKYIQHGDYGLACSEGTFGGVPTTYYDLFRVENGFIAEHWDVMETLADKDTWQNQNGKF